MPLTANHLSWGCRMDEGVCAVYLFDQLKVHIWTVDIQKTIANVHELFGAELEVI